MKKKSDFPSQEYSNFTLKKNYFAFNCQKKSERQSLPIKPQKTFNKSRTNFVLLATIPNPFSSASCVTLYISWRCNQDNNIYKSKCARTSQIQWNRRVFIQTALIAIHTYALSYKQKSNSQIAVAKAIQDVWSERSPCPSLASTYKCQGNGWRRGRCITICNENTGHGHLARHVKTTMIDLYLFLSFNTQTRLDPNGERALYVHTHTHTQTQDTHRLALYRNPLKKHAAVAPVRFFLYFILFFRAYPCVGRERGVGRLHNSQTVKLSIIPYACVSRGTAGATSKVVVYWQQYPKIM